MIDIEEFQRLHGEGWSHRRLARYYGVSLRQVQNAIDPEKRRTYDRTQNEARDRSRKLPHQRGNDVWSWDDVEPA